MVEEQLKKLTVEDVCSSVNGGLKLPSMPVYYKIAVGETGS